MKFWKRKRRVSSSRSFAFHRKLNRRLPRIFDQLEDRVLLASYDLSTYVFHDDFAALPSNSTSTIDHSGVAYSPARNSLYVVTNTNTNADIIEYSLDGTQVIRKIDLLNFEDTEGIFHLGNEEYAVVEEKTWDIFKFTITSNMASINRNDIPNSAKIVMNPSPATGDNSGIEGVSYDSTNGVYYVVKENTSQGFNKGVYRVDPTIPSGQTNWQTVNIPNLFTAIPGVSDGATDLSDIFYADGSLFTLSEDPSTVPKPEGNRIIQIDLAANGLSGTVVGQFPPPGALLPHDQPEGLTITPDGKKLIVISEPNTFSSYDQTVYGRHVFYNNSKFDGENVAANVNDDAAIATDKRALLPGGKADFVNYTSFNRGLNGIMVDIPNLPAATLSASDFEFKVGNSDTPSAWTTLASAPTVSVRAGAGVNASDRVTLHWPTGAAIKQWLQVTVKANANTGLTTPDVFYFGNAVGESGNVPGDYSVSITDELLARNNPVSINPGAVVTNKYDYNRDGTVSVVDQLLARNNITTAATRIKQITVPNAQGGAGGGAGSSSGTLPGDPVYVIVDHHTLLPNTAGQTIEIYVSGGLSVQAYDIVAQVGDGGPELTNYGLSAGTDGPAITGIDVSTGTIFASTSHVKYFSSIMPQVAVRYVGAAVQDASVTASGLLMTMTIDTTGFTSGMWDLTITNVLPYAAFGGDSDSRFHAIASVISNGTITIDEGEGLMSAGQAPEGVELYSPEGFSTWEPQGTTDSEGFSYAGDDAMLLLVETINVGLQNGVRIDIANLGNLAGLGLEDFDIRVGNLNDPGSFTTLSGSALPTLSIGDDEGVDGSTRVELEWDEAPGNYDWLEIRVKSNSDTGLAADEVFGFSLDEIFADV